MKSILFVLLFGLSSMVSATALRLEIVTLPLYLHGSDTDPRISFAQVPYVTFGSDPEWRFTAIEVAFVPPTGGTWKPHDVNLTSIYGIKVGGIYQDNGKDMLVTVDASKAAVPEGYPFTLEQVIDATVVCVKIMYPPRPADEGELRIEILRAKK